MKEKRLIEIGEWLNTQGFDLDLSDSFWMEDCRFGEHKVRDIAELLDDFCNQEVEKRIKERIPSEEEIEQWMQENRWASARQYVKWLRSRLTCSEKPNNSQKTEGGGE
jgi:hypothetical protein